ncbi:hypothetical protein [Pseudoxanthomonas mexicana]
MLAALYVAAAWLAVTNEHPMAFAWLATSAAIAVAALRLLQGHPAPIRWVAALVMLDLMVFNVGTNFNVGSATKSVLTADRAGPAQRAYSLLAARKQPGSPERAVVFGIGALTNGAAVHALPLANGYNPMLASDYQMMTGMPDAPVDAFQRKPSTPWAPDMDARLYHLLGVRWLLSTVPFPGSSDHGNGVQLAYRDSVLPRVLNPRYIRRHEVRLPPPTEFERTDFTTVLWLPEAATSACPDHDGGSVRVLAQDYRPGRIELRVESDRPAWLVVNEVAARGWWAALDDGTSVPLLRGNGLFHALCVPAGRHAIVMGYSPLLLWRDGLAARFADAGASR